MKRVLVLRDARSLPRKTLDELRRLAISRVLAGETQANVARSIQVNRVTVVKWLRKYRRGGAGALVGRMAGGRPPKLTPRQQQRLCTVVVGKTPAQLGFGMALWTLPLVRRTIEHLFGVRLHETSVDRLLRRLGLTPQKPRRRAFQRDDEACLRWAEEEFPTIVRQVKRRQATLLFLDESGVYENGPLGTTWGRRGERPIVRASGARRRINVISAISPRGRLWFRCYEEELTAAKFIDFLRALLRDVRGYIVLVLDRHPSHVAATTRNWVEQHKTRLEMHFLPPYAPELNPDENVWGYLKGMFRSDPIKVGEDLELAVELMMNEVQLDRDRVRRFFGHPEVAYVRKALRW